MKFSISRLKKIKNNELSFDVQKEKFEEAFRLRMAGKEPNYKEMTDKFLKKMKIKSIDKKDFDTYNKFYKEWINYMKNYYPEWAAYPAYIWRGWGYLTGPVTNNPDDKEQNYDLTPSQPLTEQSLPSISPDMSGGDGGGGGE